MHARMSFTYLGMVFVSRHGMARLFLYSQGNGVITGRYSGMRTSPKGCPPAHVTLYFVGEGMEMCEWLKSTRSRRIEGDPTAGCFSALADIELLDELRQQCDCAS
jgi:hypothetical protein